MEKWRCSTFAHSIVVLSIVLPPLSLLFQRLILSGNIVFFSNAKQTKHETFEMINDNLLKCAKRRQ